MSSFLSKVTVAVFSDTYSITSADDIDDDGPSNPNHNPHPHANLVPSAGATISAMTPSFYAGKVPPVEVRRQLSIARLKGMNPHRVVVSVSANDEILPGVAVMTTPKMELSNRLVANCLPQKGFTSRYKCKVLAEEMQKGKGEGRFTIRILEGPDSVGGEWGFDPWDQIWAFIDYSLKTTRHRIEVGDVLWVVWKEEEEEDYEMDEEDEEEVEKRVAPLNDNNAAALRTLEEE